MSQWNPSSSEWERAEPHWTEDQADSGTPDGGQSGLSGEQQPGWGGDPPPRRYSMPPEPGDPYLPPPTQPPMMSAPPAPPIWEDPQPPKAYLWQPPEPPGPGRRTKAVVALIAVGLFLAAGGAALALELRSHGGTAGAPAHGRSARPSQAPSLKTSPQATPTAVPTRARPSPSASPGPGSIGIAVTRAAAGNPAAPQVVDFLVSYFTAINAHDYPAFRRLLDPVMQRIETAQRFRTGFRSTVDSGAALISLATPPGGRLAAGISFTSHQSPVDSPDRSACTSWAITLYLEPTDSGYVIGPPPASYQASHQPC